MDNIKHKAIQLKSWLLGNLSWEDGKISYVKTFFFLAGCYGSKPFAIFLLEMVIKLLKALLIVIPYVIHFIEGLISALSYYINKKEFFYGL